MATNSLFIASILLSCLVANCYGVTFSSLQRTLNVTASPQQGQVLSAGEDEITVTWNFNTTFPTGTDSTYETIKLKLCYAPISQKDRGWRKTVDEIAKDKTCQHKIVSRPYSPSNNTFTFTIQKDVPTATYFIRAYAYNSANEEVAFGQNTDAKRTTNLFSIEGVTGRHLSLDIASVCFSVFSVVSLFGFFLKEKRMAKNK